LSWYDPPVRRLLMPRSGNALLYLGKMVTARPQKKSPAEAGLRKTAI
jgi:hypothetical protein